MQLTCCALKQLPFQRSHSMRAGQKLNSSSLANILFMAILGLICSSISRPAAAQGPGNVIVHSKFGGQIFGFDIDQNGTEGVLTEAQTMPDGRVLAAVETFDQATGNIVKVVKKITS